MVIFSNRDSPGDARPLVNAVVSAAKLGMILSIVVFNSSNSAFIVFIKK